jgi:type 1 fimbria pilin
MRNLAKKAGFAVTLLSVAAWPAPSNADQGNVQFWGNITNNNPCVVVLGRQGQLGVSPDFRQLSSKTPGGFSGVADIYSLFRYQISVDGPTFFMTAPVGGNNGVAFTTTYSGSSVLGGVSFPEQPGNQQVRLNAGFTITRVNIHLVANRPDAFPSGNYTAVTTVRCE